MGIEAVVVEDDKLQKAIDKAIEQADTAMPNLVDDETGFDLENLDVTGGDDELEGDERLARRHRRRAHRALRQQTTARCHPPRRVGHPLRAVRKDVPHPSAHGRRAEGSRAAARAARHEAVGAPQGHVASRHRRAPRAAGRPHQDEAVEDSRHRLPREHLPHAVRRKDRAAVFSIPRRRCSASTRWATSRSSARSISRTSPSRRA